MGVSRLGPIEEWWFPEVLKNVTAADPTHSTPEAGAQGLENFWEFFSIE